jgi:ANTAR domain
MSQTGRDGPGRLPLSPESVDAVRGVLPLVGTSAAPPQGDRLPEVLVGLAVDLVGVREAVVMLLPGGGRPEVAACSSEEVGRLCKPGVVDPQGGPGGEAACTGRAVLLEPPARTRPGHQGFTRAAVDLGFGLVHALPIAFGPVTLGSLVVFGEAALALCRPERRMLAALVEVAAVGLHQQRALQAADDRVGQLERALVSRVVIEQAKGALLARGAADLAGAFRALRVHARSHHLRLEDVAADVVGRAARDDGPVLLPPAEP